MPVPFAVPGLELHVSRSVRQKYGLDGALFGLRGNVLFANFKLVREFVAKINARRVQEGRAENTLNASELNAAGLLEEILHFVSAEYRRQRQPMALHGALDALEAQFGEQAVETLLRRFAEVFPPSPVYRGEMGLETYFAATIDGLPAREAVLEEIIMLALANENPAMESMTELFDDSALRESTVYAQALEALDAYFRTQPPFGPEEQSLLDLLREPARRVPHSLRAQLQFVLTHWRSLLGNGFYYRLLGALDFIEEETRLRIGTGGGGNLSVPHFPPVSETEDEPERFSPDRDWMPSLVMIAKHTYVWLDQLSRQYQRPITRLEHIPDRELETLARRGFSGLWLIGLWERSGASQKIKHLCGNPEAIASAYSLYDYEIAADLGGYEAWQNLRERAWRYGIRLAADMVPNHTGIYSRWVVEHPDWFISLPYSPFPAYSFNGPDLSEDPRVGIYLEDHYYTRSDAAVVFKRLDRASGETRYIYHGNDGTSMPWNDTAQLNYLNPEVREAVIQTILRVARMFPVIRFDAAMTLTKKHYQRLWFPEPGTGGAIPTRAEFGLTKEQFDAAMPREFWREVVERIAAEAPDTLLLAEAFWMMEGYFVRTLGMHRVYNSAFMNMLRDEKNAEYRAVIKNTLEFDPEILKRYVNFMNNPDERTAVEQFGKGDKYFGICLMMSTLPGLPMFGHGQVEGFAEKYGMEYRRAYWSEQPDPALVARHEAEIAPLLYRRGLFAEVENFLLYDFRTPQGFVDENVFAYSNRREGERALVVYHNKFAETSGWIRTAAAYAVKDSEGEKHLEQSTLAEGLALTDAPGWYTIFRDHKSGLEYIRSNAELHAKGLYLELKAYDYHVFLDFRQVEDTDGRYARLHDDLRGRGVPDVEAALRSLALRPIQTPLRELFNAGQFEWLLRNRAPAGAERLPEALDEVERKALKVAEAICAYTGVSDSPRALASEVRANLSVLLHLPEWEGEAQGPQDAESLRSMLRTLKGVLEADPSHWGIALSWGMAHPWGRILSPRSPEGDAAPPDASASPWCTRWLFDGLITQTLRDLGYTDAQVSRGLRTCRVLLTYPDWYRQAAEDFPSTLARWLDDPQVRSLLDVNEYQGVLWFRKESFDGLVGMMLVSGAVAILAEAEMPPEKRLAALKEIFALTEMLRRAEERSAYRVEALVKALKEVALA